MKLPILILCGALGIQAATFPYVLFYDANGPTTAIAGSRSLLAYTARQGFNWTVNATTDVFTITTAGVTATR